MEYANVDVLRRMAMHAQQLARSIDPDQLFSESWLIEQVTGVRSRGADTTASLVGSAVIDDLAALAIRFTDRAPIDSVLAPGGAFTLEQTAKKLGVGVRSIQRWRRFGLISMRFQFGRTRRIGCAGAVIEWFEKRHPELLTKVKRPAPTQQARQKLLTHARVIAAGGGTLNAAAVELARAEKTTVPVARRALEQLEKNGSISPLKRRIVLNESKAGLACGFEHHRAARGANTRVRIAHNCQATTTANSSVLEASGAAGNISARRRHGNIVGADGSSPTFGAWSVAHATARFSCGLRACVASAQKHGCHRWHATDRTAISFVASRAGDVQRGHANKNGFK